MGNNRIKKIGIILGTRPEIIKLSPIIRTLSNINFDFFIIHTNQHYTKNLDKLFFNELELPAPKYNLKVSSCTHGKMTGMMLIKIEKVLMKEKPDLILIQGDTNSVLSGALSSVKLKIKIGHIEAGLRSFDKNMPEEINRIISDHCSDYLFAPTEKAKNNLIKEGIPNKKILITGNTIVDSVFQNIKISDKKSKIMKKLGVKKNNFFLITLHRQENTESRENLKNSIEGIKRLLDNFKIPIIFPIHPRTKKMIDKFKINLKGIKTIEPLGYLDFLKLESNSLAIITDSGGIQEEACILKTPCITIRNNTERPETIKIGCNLLSGTNPEKILKKTKEILNKKIKWINPYGDGKSGKRIVNLITKINL